jgi:ribosomal protein S12 methylthiotransferase accessory factor YcaO
MAVKHAIEELVERDAVVRAWRGELNYYAVGPAFPIPGLLAFVVLHPSGLSTAVAFLERDTPPYSAAGFAARVEEEDAIRAACLEALHGSIWAERNLSSGYACRLPVRSVIEGGLMHAVRPELRPVRQRWFDAASRRSSRRRSSWQEILTRLPEIFVADLTTRDIRNLGVAVVRAISTELVALESDILRKRGGVPHPFA